jgi:hypothetical protein
MLWKAFNKDYGSELRDKLSVLLHTMVNGRSSFVWRVIRFDRLDSMLVVTGCDRANETQRRSIIKILDHCSDHFVIGMNFIRAWRMLFHPHLLSTRHGGSPLSILPTQQDHCARSHCTHTNVETYISLHTSTYPCPQLSQAPTTHTNTYKHTKSPCATTLPLLLVLLLVTQLHLLADDALVTSDGTLLLALGSVLVAASTTTSLIIVE